MASFERPQEVVALGTDDSVLVAAFSVLRDDLLRDSSYELNLATINCVPLSGFIDPKAVAAVSMRKMQSVWLQSRNGVRTPVRTYVALCSELVDALDQLTNHVGESATKTLWGAQDGLMKAAAAAMGGGRPGDVSDGVFE